MNNTLSFWVYGLPKSGKTTYLKNNFKPDLYLDFADDSFYSQIVRDPQLLENLLPENITSIALDNLHEIPEALETLNNLIKKKKFQFIFTSENLTFIEECEKKFNWNFELIDFHDYSQKFTLSLNDELNLGRIGFINKGNVVSTANFDQLLGYYLKTYIFKYFNPQNKTLFLRFIESITQFIGEQINYEELQKITGVPSRTCREYFLTLEKLNLIQLLPCHNINHNKNNQTDSLAFKKNHFYFSDLSFFRMLSFTSPLENTGEISILKNFTYLKLKDVQKNLNLKIEYFQNYQGHKIDFLINNKIALCVSPTQNANISHVRDLIYFDKKFNFNKMYLLCFDKNSKHIDTLSAKKKKQIEIVHFEDISKLLSQLEESLIEN